jgi:putative membrane protein
MIRGYSDHAANERTFLAWVRTGIAVIAFGFVIEKFDLFVRTLASADALGPEHRSHLGKLSQPLGRYEGIALIIVGAVLVIGAAVRFVRIERRLDAPEAYSAGGVRAELILSGVLALVAVGLSAYLALG